MSRTRRQPATPVDGVGVFCHNCQNPLAPDAQFCPRCGAQRLVSDTTPTQVDTRPTQVVTPRPIVRDTVVEEETVRDEAPLVRAVPRDDWSWPLVLLGVFGVLILLAVLWLAWDRDDNDDVDVTPTTAVTVPVAPAPAPAPALAPPPAPVIIQAPPAPAPTAATTTPTTAAPTTAATSPPTTTAATTATTTAPFTP